MNEEAFQEAIRNIRNNLSRLERAGDYWSEEDRDRLKQMFEEGVGISEIAIRLQRTEPAVFQQSEKMDLFHRKDRPQRRKGANRNCNCHCLSCEVDKRYCPRHIDGQQRRGQTDAGTV